MEWTIQNRNKGTTKSPKERDNIHKMQKILNKIETKTVKYYVLNCEWNK